MIKSEKLEDRYWLKKYNRLSWWKGIYVVAVALMLTGMVCLRPMFGGRILVAVNTLGSGLFIWAAITFLALAILDLLAALTKYFRSLLQKITQINWVRIDLSVLLVWGVIFIIYMWL